jgi:uncharacterized protein (TIGR02246 family)
MLIPRERPISGHQFARRGAPGAFVLACGVFVITACSTTPVPTADANAEIDSLNAHIAQAYRKHDPQAYAALWTDSAVFEWPAFNTVRGPTGMAEMARNNWAKLRDMDLRLDVTSRHITGSSATEFGSFQQAYTDTTGARFVEYGRYVAYLLRQRDGRWLMDRFFGFEDSTRRR